METKRFISVDTVTFMTDGLSINDVFSRLLHVDKLKDSSKVLVQAMGATYCRGFKCNGIQFGISISDLKRCYRDLVEIDCKEFEGSSFPFGFFDYPFDSLRTHITGEGMKYLRNNTGYGDLTDQKLLYLKDAYANIFDDFEADSGFHFTRLDIAIDVLNDETDFIKNVYTMYFNGLNDVSDRSIIFGSGVQGQRSLHVEAKYSEFERTLYFGSKNSQEIMRVYDKYLEATRGAPGVNIDPALYSFEGVDNKDIRNWTRFECQFRASACGKWLPSEGDDFCVLQTPSPLLNYIRTRYAMRFRGSGPVPFWDDYFKIFTQSPILYNGNFVQSREEYQKGIVTAERFMASAFLPWIESHCSDYKDLPVQVFRRIFDILTPRTDDQYKQQFSYFRRYLSTGRDVSDSGFLSSMFDMNSFSYDFPAAVKLFHSFACLVEEFGDYKISHLIDVFDDNVYQYIVEYEKSKSSKDDDFIPGIDDKFDVDLEDDEFYIPTVNVGGVELDEGDLRDLISD